MSQILQKLRDVDPNDSDAVKEAVTAFFQYLPKHIEVNCNTWLRALEDVITRFPRFCSQHRHTIEKFLAYFLDSVNYFDVVEAAKCAHALQQIRPTSDKAATPKNCWREQMSLLCNAAHNLIEAIFTSTVAIYKNNKNVKKTGADLLANTPLTLALARILNADKSQNTSEEKRSALVNKLRNVFVFIQAMLVEVYPVGKPIQPQLILEVIVPALTLSSGANTDPVDAYIVKTNALRTADALIACLGKNLIPYSGLVIRFVMQTLRWSSEKNNEESRKVRCGAYKCLSSWLSILHVHRIASDGKDRSWEDELAKHVVDDITMPKKFVQLTMNKIPTKNLSKKAKRKLANSQLDQSALTKYTPGDKNKEKDDIPTEEREAVAAQALECAETFLTVCGIFLKQTTHKLFHERLVRECYNSDTYSPTRVVRLLRALDAARKNTPSTVPPPTQYCVQLYSMLVNSQCEEIRNFCSQALLDIRLQLHCSPPSINFALEAQQNPKKSTVWDKLGTKSTIEKFLTFEDPEMQKRAREIEARAEEPTSLPVKKRRLTDHDGARISISSDEGNVVISDDSENEIQVVADVHENENREKSSPDSASSVDMSEVTDDSQIAPGVPNLDQICLPPLPKPTDIHEAKTQVLNNSTDTIDGDKSPVSMEIAYDLPQTPKKVTLIEKQEDESLPSTNETDDIQITCGQKLESSPETTKEVEIVTKEVAVVDEDVIPVEETNGTKEVNSDDGIENTDVGTKGKADIEVKITSTEVTEVTVDDMLADFVDEVIDEPKLVT